MIIDVLLGRRPLYLVEKNYAEMDVELIFGKGFKSSDFNDDALARTLDKIYAAGAKKVFCHASLQALLKEELNSDILHADTTAKLVYGDYPVEKGLNITFGYNKERRRNLKQFKIGLYRSITAIRGGCSIWRVLIWIYLHHRRSDFEKWSRKSVIGNSKGAKGELQICEVTLSYCILHSDQGSHYASYYYQHLLWRYGIICSMSCRGNYWDNAVMESFFHTFKVELVYNCRFETRSQTRRTIFEYIEVFYNRIRIHSAIGYNSPEEYEKERKVA